MWLPKDERRLIAGYYRSVGKPGGSNAYEWAEVHRLFCKGKPKIRSYRETVGDVPHTSTGDAESSTRASGVIGSVDKRVRVEHINNVLHQRGLVRVTPHHPQGSVFVIDLTLEGYDLGRRYDSWFESTGLWFQEMRNHWIWLIVSFLGGVLGVLVVGWLTKADPPAR